MAGHRRHAGKVLPPGEEMPQRILPRRLIVQEQRDYPVTFDPSECRGARDREEICNFHRLPFASPAPPGPREYWGSMPEQEPTGNGELAR